MTEGPDIQNNLQYAGLWPRFLALMIDGIVFCAAFFPVTKLVKGVWLMSPGDHKWTYGMLITDPLCLTFLAVIFLYFAILEGLTGMTIGKWATGLRVIRAGDDVKPGLLKGISRNVLRLVDGLPAFCILGVVLILVSNECARFGDRCAGTRVIRIAKKS